MDRSSAAATLQRGLEANCADDIAEVLCNLADGTCDYVELIPLLEQVAIKNLFHYFDDNGAGGMPHPTGEPASFRDWASQAIENIKENKKLESSSRIAVPLKSLDTRSVKSALKQLATGGCKDESLIPILEKIVRKDEYRSYSYFTGYSSPSKLGETARRAIQKIRKNIEEDPV